MLAADPPGGTGRDRDPGWLRRAWHRGQDRRRRLRPRARPSVPRALPRAAHDGGRLRPLGRRPRGRQLARVRRRHPAPGHRPHGRPGRRRRQGRHDAPRRLPRPAAAWLAGRRHLRRGDRLRAASPSLRGQSPLPRPPRGRHGLAARAHRRTIGWSSSSSFPGHPFWVGTQAHPEFKSRPDRPHPLFRGLVGAALNRAHERNPRLLELDMCPPEPDSDERARPQDQGEGLSPDDRPFREIGERTRFSGERLLAVVDRHLRRPGRLHLRTRDRAHPDAVCIVPLEADRRARADRPPVPRRRRPGAPRAARRKARRARRAARGLRGARAGRRDRA